MRFKVIDKQTGKDADPKQIALKEDWAKDLIYCDMEGFAILEDGGLMLLDECGNYAFCPAGRFEIAEESSPTIDDLAMLVRKMVDKLPEDSDLRKRAWDYLRRKGLEGSILREDKVARVLMDEVLFDPENSGHWIPTALYTPFYNGIYSVWRKGMTEGIKAEWSNKGWRDIRTGGMLEGEFDYWLPMPERSGNL